MNNDLSANTLELIFEYMAKIESIKKIDTVLILLAEMGRELVHADRCTLWIADDEKKLLWTKVAQGIDRIQIPYATGLVGHTISTGTSNIVNDPYSDDRFNQDVDRKTGYQTKSIITIPISNSEGEVMGAFQAINKMSEDAKFTDFDMKFLKLSSTYAGEAIETAMLHEEIENTQRELIFTLSEVAEMRSKETGNHVKRVAEYSKLLALHHGIPLKEAELLKLASPMHDIGKIAIPDAILNKPARLTEQEFVIMRKHTDYGHSMLKKSKRKILKAAAIVASQHHEKYDGSGYPLGLKGDEIHIYGRISSIADVFDALGSERVYKRTWPLEEILEEFKAQSGRHFDPNLIKIFFDHLDEFLAVRDEFKDVFHDEE